MSGSLRRLDRAAEERPWLTGLATGLPSGILLAVVTAAVDGGEGFADPMGLLTTGIVQGLVIAVLVAAGGAWRRRSRRDRERADEVRRERDADD